MFLTRLRSPCMYLYYGPGPRNVTARLLRRSDNAIWSKGVEQQRVSIVVDFSGRRGP